MRIYIVLTTGQRLLVEDGAGPLADVDLNDPDDRERGTQQIWERIEERGEIWTDGAGIWRFNPANVVAVVEAA